MKSIKRVPHSPYSKELSRFIEKLKKLAEQGKLNYEQDPFWSATPQKLGKTNSSELDAPLYLKS